MASSNSIFSNIPQEVLDILNTEQKAQLWDIFIAQSKEQTVQSTIPVESKHTKKRGKDKSHKKSRHQATLP